MTQLMDEIPDDLPGPAATWTALEASVKNLPVVGPPTLTRLRMLDMLVWWKGSTAPGATRTAGEPASANSSS